MSDKQPTPEQLAEVLAALKAGTAIVCYSKCWPCQFGQCTDEPHTWMDADDREHAGIPAATTAAELAAQKPCGCHCMGVFPHPEHGMQPGAAAEHHAPPRPGGAA